MTNREFYAGIAAMTNIEECYVEHAAAMIEKMDKQNALRREKPSKTELANAPLIEQILTSVLTKEAKTAFDIGGEIGVSTQKASALMRKLVGEGKATVCDVKGPKGKCKGYTVVE